MTDPTTHHHDHAGVATTESGHRDDSRAENEDHTMEHGDHAGHGIALSAVLGAGVIGYCAFSGWLLRYEWGREDRRAVRSGEVFAMTVAVVGMTLAM